MTTSQNENLEPVSISDKDVADYLEKHPEFFDRYPELLAELKLRHATGNAISLIERQVDVLRGQKRDLDQKLNNLIQIARENDALNKRVQKMTLSLIEADNLQDIIATIQDSLRQDFEADSVVIRLFHMPLEELGNTDVAVVDPADTQLEIFKRFFESRKPICGRLGKEQGEYLFGDNAGDIASAALLPICSHECYGMLAIGSTDSKRFYSGMGTVFLTYLGDMIGRVIKPHLATAENAE
jgi:uncharacterized protein YigA (DUF484 family)